MAHQGAARPVAAGRRDTRLGPARQRNSYQGTITSKGQLVIPAELRRRYHIKKGTPVRFDDVEGGILVCPITKEYIHSLRGILAGRGLPVNIEREPDMR